MTGKVVAKDTEKEVLKRRLRILVKKIDPARNSLEHGGYSPGTPLGICPIPGETRKQRLWRWERAILALEQQIATLSKIEG